MSAYAETRRVAKRIGITPDEVQELLETYADDVRAAEPQASRVINAAEMLALELADDLEEDG